MMKRWLPWIAAPLCLLALLLSIFRPHAEHHRGGDSYTLRGPSGHAFGLTIWGEGSRMVSLWWERKDATGWHAWKIDAGCYSHPRGPV